MLCSRSLEDRINIYCAHEWKHFVETKKTSRPLWFLVNSQSVYDRLVRKTHRLYWKTLGENNIKQMITKILNTCRMCSKHFVLTWEKHEVQEPHFTDNKEIKTNANWFLFVGCACITLWFSFSTRYCWLCLGIGNREGERELAWDLQLRVGIILMSYV